VTQGPSYWFVCPQCNIIGSIDDDQANARISIEHTTAEGGCGFHQTGTVQLKILVTDPLPRDVAIIFAQTPNN